MTERFEIPVADRQHPFIIVMLHGLVTGTKATGASNGYTALRLRLIRQ
jgi:hypothetical protein